MTLELTIDHIGAGGDGVANEGGQTYYIPFTAPGDRITAPTGFHPPAAISAPAAAARCSISRRSLPPTGNARKYARACPWPV